MPETQHSHYSREKHDNYCASAEIRCQDTVPFVRNPSRTGPGPCRRPATGRAGRSSPCSRDRPLNSGAGLSSPCLINQLVSELRNQEMKQINRKVNVEIKQLHHEYQSINSIKTQSTQSRLNQLNQDSINSIKTQSTQSRLNQDSINSIKTQSTQSDMSKN